MTHPKYTAKYLLKKGISYCKQIAKELGVAPEGDKRQLFTWVEAIVEHQSSLQPVEIEKPEAVIEYKDGIDTCELQGYMVISDGVVVRDNFRSYLQAEKWASARYSLVNPQEVAQNELEIEMEAQAQAAEKTIEVVEQHFDEGFVKFVVQSNENFYAVTPAHPLPKERCECGDNHFRGTECKHQVAVKNELISQISFISPTGFGDWEAVVNGEVIGVIEHDFDNGEWRVGMRKGTKSFDSYLEAENFIKDEYIRDVFMNDKNTGELRSKPVILVNQLELLGGKKEQEREDF